MEKFPPLGKAKRCLVVHCPGKLLIEAPDVVECFASIGAKVIASTVKAACE